MKIGTLKHIALLLTAALLMSVFLPAGLRVKAADEAVFRQDFEAGSAAALGTADGNDADGYYAVGSVSVVSGGADGSAYCLKVSGAEHGNGQWLNNLEPNTDYVITFSAKIANWGGNAFPNVGVNGYDGSAYQAIDTFTEQWAKYSLRFKTGASSTDACIYTWIFGSGAVDLFLDNLLVCKASHVHSYTSAVTTAATCGSDGLMTYTCACGDTYTEVIPATGEHNYVDGICTACGHKKPAAGSLEYWHFEDNDLSLLGTPDGNDADGYHADGNISIVSGGANGSAYALCVDGTECGNGIWVQGLEPDTDYTLTFWAKKTDCSDTAFPNVGVNGYDGDAYVACDQFTGTWAEYQLNFHTGAGITGAHVYTWTFGSGTAKLYLDSVTLRKADHIHHYTAETTKAATCAEDGVITYTCVCGDAYTEAIPATGNHNYVNGVCAVCGKSEASQEKSGFPDAWDFEHNRLSALGTPDGGDADGYYAEGSVSIVSGGANGTKYALKISNANSGNGQWITGLKPDTEYRLTFWAKIVNWGGNAFPNFGVNGYDGDKFVAADSFTENWQQYELAFKTGKDSDTACIYSWIFGSGAVDFLLDEVKLTEKTGGGTDDQKTGLELWDFEHNMISKLGTPNGEDADGYYAIGDISIVPGGANGTKYSLRINGVEHGNGLWVNDLKPSTNYTLTFWAKLGSCASTAFPNFGVNGYNGDKFQAVDSFTHSWAKYSIVFRTGAKNTSACVYSWIFGSGSAELFIDEVTLKQGGTLAPEKTEEGNVPPTDGTGDLSAWDFESGDTSALGTPDGSDADGYYAVGDVSVVEGGANDSAYCLHIVGAEVGNGQWVTGLEPDTDYTLTFWAKTANCGGEAFPNFGVNGYDGGAYQAIDVFTGTWQQYTLNFHTGKDSTSACIYSWIFGSGSAELFVDDVILLPASEASAGKPNPIPLSADTGRSFPETKEEAPVVFAAESSGAQLVTPLIIASSVLGAAAVGTLLLLLLKKRKKKE